MRTSHPETGAEGDRRIQASRGATATTEIPVTIRTSLRLSPRVERDIREGLARKLAGQARKIQRVTVRLIDHNGPKGGGDDIECELKVVIERAPTVVVKERAGEPGAAFDLALPRLARVLLKDLETHGLKRGRGPHRVSGRAAALAAGGEYLTGDGLAIARADARRTGGRTISSRIARPAGKNGGSRPSGRS
jgi:hypothetical protein